MAGNAHGSLRELLRNNFEVHPTGLDASLFHLHDGSLLGQISQAPERELLVRMVLLAFPYWHQHWLCNQRQVGWPFLYRPGWALYSGGSVEQVWGLGDAKGRSQNVLRTDQWLTRDRQL